MIAWIMANPIEFLTYWCICGLVAGSLFGAWARATDTDTGWEDR